MSANSEEIYSLTNNTWSLWCPLFVVLLRTIASQEELVGQGRIASRSVLEYADVLLCHGHYQSAFASYSRAISGLMDISSDGEIQIEKPWTDLKRITLLKSLYCSVAQGNRVGHIIAAVSLRKTQLKSSDFINKNNMKVLGHSNSSDSRCSLSGHLSPSSNNSPWEDKQRSAFFTDRFSTMNTNNAIDNILTRKILPFRLYFEVQNVAVVYDMKNQSVMENRAPREKIDLSAGVTYTLKIELLSLFPCTVQVDAVSVLYLQQHCARTTSGSLSNPTSITSSPHHPSPDLFSNFSFTALCTASASEYCDEVEDNMNLIFIPGEMKTICLKMTAPVDKGNYSANEIIISVKAEGESVDFLGEESDQKLCVRKANVTSSILMSLPLFSVKKKSFLSSIEENSVPHVGLVHASDKGMGNKMNCQCPLNAKVHQPLFLPLRVGSAGIGVVKEGLNGSQFSQNILNREFIIQVEINNKSQSTACITAVKLSNPRDFRTSIALIHDRNKSDERPMEIYLIGNPMSPILHNFDSVVLQLGEILNPISLMSGETYCAAFKFIIKEISIGPLDTPLRIGETTSEAIKAGEAVAGSPSNIVNTNGEGPAMLFTCELPGVKDNQSYLEVSLSSSLEHLSDAIEETRTGSNCIYSHSDKSLNVASITAAYASSTDSETGNNYMRQELITASRIEMESQGEEKMGEDERGRFIMGGMGGNRLGGKNEGLGSSRRVLTTAALIKSDDSAYGFSAPTSCHPR